MDEIEISSSGNPSPELTGPTSAGPALSRAFLIVPIAGLIGAVIAISRYRPVDQDLFFWTLLLRFSAAFFLIKYIRQKIRIGSDVSYLLPITYLMLFAPAVLGLGLWLNGSLDHSPPESHRQVVTGKFTSHRRHGTSYYIELTSWREHRTTERVSVPPRQYAQFQVDDPIIVEVYRGALAIPWIGKID